MTIKSILKRCAFLVLVPMMGGIILLGWMLVLHASAAATKGVQSQKSLPVLAPYMVKDINPLSLDSSPGTKVYMNGALYFTADDNIHGLELWKSDGTLAGTILVKDFNPGSKGSSVHSLTVMNGVLFFAANDGVHGDRAVEKRWDCWRNLRLVEDIWPGFSGH